MNTANHLSEDDLYLFALQLLPDAEMRAAALHLKECAQCRAEVGEIQGDLVTYAMTADMQAPPAEARARLMSQVAKEKKLAPVAKVEAPVAPKVEAQVAPKVEAKVASKVVAPVEPVLSSRGGRMFEMDSHEEKKSRRVAPALAWIGWAIAAGAAVAAGLQYQQRKQVEQNLSAETAQLDEMTAQTAQAKELMQALTDKQAMQVSLHVPLTARQQPKLDPEGHATYVPGKGALMFVASHLDPLDPQKTYELWLLPAEAGVAPIPAGLFKPDANGNASLVLPELPKGVTAKGFGVTVENDGGSKTPTAPIVLAGM
jgi:hypothetical protein